MAKLDAAQRASLPASDFGIPGQKKYPIPDKSHAANAKARASQAENAGRISKATEESIDRKADRKLGKGPDARRQTPVARRGHTNIKNPGNHADKMEHC